MANVYAGLGEGGCKLFLYEADRKTAVRQVLWGDWLNVDVYGAIYLKTDGERLITAFKIETNSDKKKWFYYEFALTPAGELVLID